MSENIILILFLQCEYDESFFDDTPQIMPVREIYSTSLPKKGFELVANWVAIFYCLLKKGNVKKGRKQRSAGTFPTGLPDEEIMF